MKKLAIKHLCIIYLVVLNLAMIAPGQTQNTPLTDQTLTLSTIQQSKLSPGAIELASYLHLNSLIIKITTPTQVNLKETPQSLDDVISQFQLLKIKARYNSVLFKTSLQIDAFLSLLQKEINEYHESQMILSERASKRINLTNFASYWSNGALWAVAEALVIPTYRQPYAKLAIASGSTGILAGLIPSAFSLYSLPFVSNKKYPCEANPNMLAALFNYQIPASKEYPLTIWKYLNAPSLAPETTNLTRRDVLINGWVKKGFIAKANDTNAKDALDSICNTVSKKNGLTINTLAYRETMLSDLSSIVSNLKTYLEELIQLTVE